MTPIDPAFLLIPILKAIKLVSISTSKSLLRLSPLSSTPCSWSSFFLALTTQDDGSVGLFQPLDDIFDEAASKIVRSVNERTPDDAPGFPPISPEDMLSLTRYDCIISCMNRICDFQSACAALSPSLLGRYCPHMIDKRRCHPGAYRLPLL